MTAVCLRGKSCLQKANGDTVVLAVHIEVPNWAVQKAWGQGAQRAEVNTG